MDLFLLDLLCYIDKIVTIPGRTIKTAKSNWLRYPSGIKYAILFTNNTRNQFNKKNRTYLNSCFLAGSPQVWPLYKDRQQAG